MNINERHEETEARQGTRDMAEEQDKCLSTNTTLELGSLLFLTTMAIVCAARTVVQQ